MRRAAPYLKLAARAARANLGRPDFPFKLTFCVTFWCNYRCTTCNIWKMKPRDELSLEEIRSFFQRSNRFSWIDLTGGEVSLRKDFVDICEAALTFCPDLLLLHYPTNGYLSDALERITREVARMGPERFMVTVSMDGDEAMNDEIRGVEGGWRRQIETFRRLRRIPGVDVVLGMTLSARNVDHFPQAFRAAQAEVPDLRVRDFHVNIVTEGEHYLGNQELGLRRAVEPEALARATEEYARLRGFGLHPVSYLERAYLSQVRRYLESGRTPMHCHALRSSCFIDSWGHVFPCTIYDRRIGSLREEDYDLARIWRSPLAVRTQEEIWQSDCPQCWTPCEAYPSIIGNFLRGRLGLRAAAPGRCGQVGPAGAGKHTTDPRLQQTDGSTHRSAAAQRWSAHPVVQHEPAQREGLCGSQLDLAEGRRAQPALQQLRLEAPGARLCAHQARLQPDQRAPTIGLEQAEQAPGPEHPRRLDEGRLWIRQVVQQVPYEDRGEGSVRKGKRHRLRSGQPCFGQLPHRKGELAGKEVDSDTAYPAEQPHQVVALTAAHLEARLLQLREKGLQQRILGLGKAGAFGRPVKTLRVRILEVGALDLAGALGRAHTRGG